jgi:hypothetical protein
MKLRVYFLVLFACLFVSGCPCILGVGDCDKGKINVDPIFWTAFRDPETFDTWLTGQTIDPAAPGCMRHLAAKAFNEEQAQLQECSQMVSGTPAWNECHEEAEAAHDRGVVLNDVARACDGTIRFDATQGGQWLISAKTIVGESEWYSFTDILRQSLPPFECSR